MVSRSSGARLNGQLLLSLMLLLHFASFFRLNQCPVRSYVSCFTSYAKMSICFVQGSKLMSLSVEMHWQRFYTMLGWL